MNKEMIFEIDLGMVRKKTLNETSFGMFGAYVEAILSGFMGGNFPTGMLRGTGSEIDAFIRSLKGEKNYIDAYQRYGLNDPKTFASERRLNRAIENFQRETGIKWPVK